MSGGSFLSSDGITNIQYSRWVGGESAARAVLLIAHGMAEYIGRYDGFARFMAENGYAVYGNDHLGHGRSGDETNRGWFAQKDGRYLVVDDMRFLSRVARGEFPGLPVILLGHSMGSFIARLFCEKYSDDIDAAIFMGTSGKQPLSGVAVFLTNIIGFLRGEKYKSRFLDKLCFGTNNSRLKNPRTPFDWLNTDEGEVDKYIGDELCGFTFTVSAYRELFRMIREVNRPGWADKIRKDLPVLVISGGEDPVGNCGEGVTQVYNDLKSAGVNNSALILYEGMRHEILNEKDKQRVYQDILKWTDGGN